MKHDRRYRKHDEFQPHQMNRQEHQRHTNQGRRDRHHDDRDVERDQVEERALNVLEDVAAFANRRHNRCEVVVEEDRSAVARATSVPR